MLLAAVPLGLLTRWGLGDGLGLGFAAWVAGLLSMFLLVAGREGRHQARGARVWALVALFFAGMVAVRESPALVAFDVAAALGFLLLAARDAVNPPDRARLFDFPAGALQASVGAAQMSWWVAHDAAQSALEARASAPQSARSVAKGLMLSVPVVGVFGLLLAAGDGAFREALEGLGGGQALGTVASWGAWSVVLGVGCAGLLGWALRRSRPHAPVAPHVGWQLGATEGVVVLGSVVALFAAFLMVQAAWLFTQDPSARGTGLTYATWAREGFGELTVVAALTWWLVETARRRIAVPEPRQDLAVRIAGTLVSVQALFILVSAHLRLALYDEVYGFTLTRIFAHAGIAFLGLSLLARLVTLWVVPRATATLVVAGGVAVLSALNVMNPDAFVVSANLQRPQDVVSIDWDYLSQLSADAAPALEPVLAAASGEHNNALLERWACRRREVSLSNWNLGRARARRLANFCTGDDLTEFEGEGR